jgi:thiol-disulfide isomerase/thioredoxin
LIVCVIALFVLGQYVQAGEVKPRLVVFVSKWCEACRTAKPVIDEIEAAGYKVTRYDADEEPDVLKKYKVRSLPTFLIYRDNDLVLRTSYVEAVKVYFE